MAKVCDICGKKPVTGYNVSHAHNKTKKRWYPNLQSVKCVVNGQPVKINRNVSRFRLICYSDLSPCPGRFVCDTLISGCSWLRRRLL